MQPEETGTNYLVARSFFGACCLYYQRPAQEVMAEGDAERSAVKISLGRQCRHLCDSSRRIRIHFAKQERHYPGNDAFSIQAVIVLHIPPPQETASVNFTSCPQRPGMGR